MVDLRGKATVIAGGGRGIGRAIALAFAACGSSVVIGSRTEAQVAGTAEDIRAAGGTADAYPLDVTDRDSVAAFVRLACERHRHIDHFVYVAGTNKRFPAESYPEEAWDQVMDANLKGAYLCCREIGRRMIAQGGGSIVAITSMLSHIATPNQSAYTASKGGLLQYTKLLAIEWGKYNIRVNAVSPGYVETDLNAANFNKASFRQAILGKTALQRFGAAEDVANAVCFLSSSAASYITGVCIPVDGGFLAGHPAIIME